ncbi:hypothetical protein [Ottowia sp. SB7-C50]|uniref:hypothetical protein n=1 Tax=Ottowia sp. SB7-C50 TaxID=3081231 RepID=UPI002955B2E2|nr:hypothetical protein [Ottowia sp. SB7-C50]WOP15134.1 hypothetical protein R0D99_15145 [Ottowia sp. SB7-C50]
MIWHLLAVFIMGLCMGALAYALRRLTRQKLPKWLIPVFAAAGMLGYLAYYDYHWYEFKQTQLPKGSTVVQEHRKTSFFRPWSYAYPSVSAFTVLDGQFSIRPQDGQRLVEYFEYTFRQDPIEGLDTQAFVLNCQTLERVPFDRQQGKVSGPVQKISADHPVFQKACH